MSRPSPARFARARSFACSSPMAIPITPPACRRSGTTWPSVEACKLPLRGESGWRALSDGETVRAGDRMLTVMHTPGHAPDHACFWDPERRHLYTGDMLILGTSVDDPIRARRQPARVPPLARAAGRAEARADFSRARATSSSIRSRSSTSTSKHRQLRERQILECLADGVTDVDAIVRRLYPGLATGLQSAARSTVEAHLQKLRDEGRLT